MAVPGSIFSALSEGANALIKDGAKTVTSADDILAELRPTSVARQMVASELLALDEVEQALLNALGSDPIHIDDIAHEAALPMSVVSSALAMMELKELVRQVGAMNYVRGTHSWQAS
jgi:DNA processing protein